MNYELNQMVGLKECDQSKVLGMLVQQHMSIMQPDRDPKFDRWIGRMW